MEKTGPTSQFAQPLRVLFVNTLKSFWFALESDYQRLESLMTAMQKFYSSPRATYCKSLTSFQVGKMYAVYCYQEWYRARLDRLIENGDLSAHAAAASDTVADQKPPDMAFTLVDFGDSIVVTGGGLATVAMLVSAFRELPPVALHGRMASVYPRPGLEQEASQQFLAEVKNRLLYGFCLRTPEDSWTEMSWPYNPEPYHLQLFFVPTALDQTEYHGNGVDGRLLNAGLVHKWEEHCKAAHLRGAWCSYCEDGERADDDEEEEG